jgi:NAD(P)-dependent dehydrogenase (short-subunit alcohol dehydrogenase family)
VSASLAGRVVLVTGAGRGVGRGIVDALAAEGASVVATVHHATDAASILDTVGGPVVAPVCDVTLRSDVDAAVARSRRSGDLTRSCTTP